MIRYCFYARLHDINTVWTSGGQITLMQAPHGHYSVIAELVCCER